MIEQAKKHHPEANFKVMDVCKLDFSDNTFDGIWANASYLHVPKDQINQALTEANRVLKLGGFGYVVIKKGNVEMYIGEEDAKRYWSFYGKAQFAKLLKQNGFEVLKSWEDKSDYNPPSDVTVFLEYIIKKVK